MQLYAAGKSSPYFSCLLLLIYSQLHNNSNFSATSPYLYSTVARQMYSKRAYRNRGCQDRKVIRDSVSRTKLRIFKVIKARKTSSVISAKSVALTLLRSLAMQCSPTSSSCRCNIVMLRNLSVCNVSNKQQIKAARDLASLLDKLSIKSTLSALNESAVRELNICSKAALVVIKDRLILGRTRLQMQLFNA